jgi:uncharacterized membrane-anchored protein
MKRLIVILTLAASLLAPFANAAVWDEVVKLNWQQADGTYSIPNTNASIAIKGEQGLVVGQDADEFLTLMQGTEYYSTAAVVYDEPTAALIVYNINTEGYFTQDDWTDIDATEMMLGVKKETATANIKREKNGLAPLFIDGWAQEPYLNASENTVYWATKGHSDTGSFINVTALKLGVEGYTRINWVGEVSVFGNAEETLAPVLANYEYKDGFQYVDYVKGEHALAGMGIGAVVTKLITGKKGKATVASIGAMILVLLKKAWFVILLPLAFLWNWVKSKNQRKEVSEASI